MVTLVGQGELLLHHHQLGRKPTQRHQRLARARAHSRPPCVAESEAALSDQSEQASEPGLIWLLRKELGLSSSDLFSMTVTDYDMKPGVGGVRGEPGPNAPASWADGLFPPPPESLRRSSVCSGPL